MGTHCLLLEISKPANRLNEKLNANLNERVQSKQCFSLFFLSFHALTFRRLLLSPAIFHPSHALKLRRLCHHPRYSILCHKIPIIIAQPSLHHRSLPHHRTCRAAFWILTSPSRGHPAFLLVCCARRPSLAPTVLSSVQLLTAYFLWRLHNGPALIHCLSSSLLRRTSSNPSLL